MQAFTPKAAIILRVRKKLAACGAIRTIPKAGYLFEDDDKKYLLISADYLGDYEFDVFPHLLKFENGEFNKLEFVLQREIMTQNNSPEETTSNTALFEYIN